MTMKRKYYIKPTISVICPDPELMQTFHVGGSGYTNDGDDSGGGLAKKGFLNTKDKDNDQQLPKFQYNAWEDD